MASVKTKDGRKLFKHRDLLFFAKGGMIRIFDNRDGTEATITCVEGAERAEALGLESKRANRSEDRTLLEEGANDMLECAKLAAAQGDPTDPHVQAYYSRHKQSRPSQGVTLVP